jgi:hypothetical protein
MIWQEVPCQEGLVMRRREFIEAADGVFGAGKGARKNERTGRW